MFIPTGQESDTEDDYDSTNYWCFETMKTFGPDDRDGRRPRVPQSIAALLRTHLTGTRAKSSSPTGSPRAGRYSHASGSGHRSRGVFVPENARPRRAHELN